jgi:NAD(P)-dependent dehydrogenase (short-subunit alcohol dehydrogenase family)
MSYLDQLFSLRNQTVLVSGGAGVLGTVLSAGLLRAGARVIVWSRSRKSVDEAVANLSNMQDRKGRVFGYQVDSGNEKQVAAALRQSAVDAGPPDILVNAVGGNIGKSAFVETDMQQFNTVLQMNLVAGLMVPTKIVAAYWIEHQIAGAIINLASMTSYNPLSGVWAYNAAKAGVLNLTQAAANEFAPYGIRVNAVAPGFFLGKQNRALLVDESSGQYTPRGKAILARTPYGRFGEPEELIGAVLFLASNKAAGFVTGISIPVDGGYLAHNI